MVDGFDYYIVMMERVGSDQLTDWDQHYQAPFHTLTSMAALWAPVLRLPLRIALALVFLLEKDAFRESRPCPEICQLSECSSGLVVPSTVGGAWLLWYLLGAHTSHGENIWNINQISHINVIERSKPI